MKWHRLLTAGVVLGLAVTACRNSTQTGAAAPGSSRPPAVASARVSPSAVATGSPYASQTPSSPPPSAPSAPAVASGTVWLDCSSHGRVEPSDYILTCADAGSVLSQLAWRSWTARQAVATGVHQLNDFTPNRAEGEFIDYPVVVLLWRSEPVSGHPGERYFTRITVRYTGNRPPAYTSYGQLIRHPAQWTEPLGPFGT